METPYGGLWYAAGNPDGSRFGSVNRPSPPLAIYRVFPRQVQKSSAKCLRTGRPSTQRNALSRPPDSPRHPPLLHSGSRFCRLGLPIPSSLLLDFVCVRSGGVGIARRSCSVYLHNPRDASKYALLTPCIHIGSPEPKVLTCNQ